MCFFRALGHLSGKALLAWVCLSICIQIWKSRVGKNVCVYVCGGVPESTNVLSRHLLWLVHFWFFYKAWCASAACCSTTSLLSAIAPPASSPHWWNTPQTRCSCYDCIKESLGVAFWEQGTHQCSGISREENCDVRWTHQVCFPPPHPPPPLSFSCQN